MSKEYQRERRKELKQIAFELNILTFENLNKLLEYEGTNKSTIIRKLIDDKTKELNL